MQNEKYQESQTMTVNIFILPLLHYKIYIFFENNIQKNLPYTVAIALQFFWVAVYLKKTKEPATTTGTQLEVLGKSYFFKIF